jgi:murein DD-endopeptidase MepM/ murein hydrolase activator NlpD
MVRRLSIAIMMLGSILRMSGANADPQPEPMLVPPVSPACISSPFGPRVLANHPQAGTYHHGVDLPAPPGIDCGDGARQVIRIQKKGPAELEILVRHDGFVAIYSHLGMAAPSFAQGNRSVAAGEKFGVVGRTGAAVGTHVYFKMLIDESRLIRLRICMCRNAPASDEPRRKRATTSIRR